MSHLTHIKHPAAPNLLLVCLLTVLPSIATAQRIAVTNKTIDCGKTAFQKPVTATFEIKNKSLKRLTISNVQPDCGCTTAKLSKKNLGVGEKCTLELTYDAQMLGHFTKQAAVYTGSDSQPLYLTMKGVVVSEMQDYSDAYPYQVGDMLTDMNVVEFDNVNKGDEPQQTIHILNNSTSVMTPNMQHLPSYLTAVASPEKLRPGQRGIITVTLNSRQVHNYGLTQSTIYLAGQLGEKVQWANELPVSVVTLPDLSTFDGKNKQYAPQMVLTADTVWLGNINGKTKKSETIVLSNQGRTPLNISSLQMFTPGLKLTLGKRELQPGEQTKLKITADRDKLVKSKTKPRVLMITNDPDHSKVIINIKVK